MSQSQNQCGGRYLIWEITQKSLQDPSETATFLQRWFHRLEEPASWSEMALLLSYGWTFGLVEFKPKPNNEAVDHIRMMISNLINIELHGWKINLLQDLFDQSQSKLFFRIPILLRPRLVKLIWMKNTKGAFSVKSAYMAS